MQGRENLPGESQIRLVEIRLAGVSRVAMMHPEIAFQNVPKGGSAGFWNVDKNNHRKCKSLSEYRSRPSEQAYERAFTIFKNPAMSPLKSSRFYPPQDRAEFLERRSPIRRASPWFEKLAGKRI